MKGIIFALFALGAILFFACTPKTTQKVIEKPTEISTPPQGDANQDEPSPNVGRPAFGKAMIKKTACYGACPVFELTFDGAGKAYYHGKKHVKRKGKWEALLTRNHTTMILEKAQQIGYFRLAENYPLKGQPIADFPFTITMLKFGPDEKTIMNNHDAPDKLIEYEEFLIDLGDKLDWQKAGDQ